MSYFGVNGYKKTPRTINASQVREEDSHRQNVSGLERDYKENTSAISFRQKRLKESLLAYTKRLQALTRNRFADAQSHLSEKENGLIVRASRIRRRNNIPSDNGPRKVMSLNELLNRPSNHTMKSEDDQLCACAPDKVALPSIDSVKQTNPTVVSLANASDIDEMCIPVRNGMQSSKQNNAKPSTKHPHTNRDKLDLLTDALPRIEHTLLKNTIELQQQQQQQPTSPKDIYVILSNNNSRSKVINGNGVPESTKFQSENKSRKRRKDGKKLLYKRMKLPILDSIPEMDDDRNFSSAGTNRTRQRLSASRASVNTSSEYYKPSFLPTLVSSNTKDLPSVVRGHRKRERKIHDDQDTPIPPKRPNSSEDTRQETSNRQVRLRLFIGEDKYLPSVQENKSHPGRQKRYGRLIFLKDSPEKN